MTSHQSLTTSPQSSSNSSHHSPVTSQQSAVHKSQIRGQLSCGRPGSTAAWGDQAPSGFKSQMLPRRLQQCLAAIQSLQQLRPVLCCVMHACAACCACMYERMHGSLVGSSPPPRIAKAVPSGAGFEPCTSHPALPDLAGP